jgi:hypothetical protein
MTRPPPAAVSASSRSASLVSSSPHLTLLLAPFPRLVGARRDRRPLHQAIWFVL